MKDRNPFLDAMENTQSEDFKNELCRKKQSVSKRLYKLEATLPILGTLTYILGYIFGKIGVRHGLEGLGSKPLILGCILFLVILLLWGIHKVKLVSIENNLKPYQASQGDSNDEISAEPTHTAKGTGSDTPTT